MSAIFLNHEYFEEFFLNHKYSEEELRELIKQFLPNDTQWNDICYWQKLSEEFIREFQDKVDWDCISRYQNLSEEFIREFKNKIKWHSLIYNEKIQVSDRFTMEFDKELGHCNIWKINGEYHRMLGPAIICRDGEKKYWYRGKQIKVATYNKYIEWLNTKDF